MDKLLFKGVPAVFFLLLFSCGLLQIASAQERLTITTYYPSPYGSYNELSTNFLDYGTNPSPMPISGSPCTKEGQTAYSSTDKTVYLCNGASWKQLGGGVVSYTQYCFTDPALGTPPCPPLPDSSVIGTPGPCISGFTVRAALGSWGSSTCGPAAPFPFFLPPGSGGGVGCNTGPGTGTFFYVGRAYVCSQ